MRPVEEYLRKLPLPLDRWAEDIDRLDIRVRPGPATAAPAVHPDVHPKTASEHREPLHRCDS
jgi:hypothetical protein